MSNFAGYREEESKLQQTQFAGTGDGFRAPLTIKFAINPAVVPFDRIQCQE